MIKLTDEEKDTLSYNDVAYLILKDTNKKIKIQDLFKEVIKAMDLPEYTFEDDIEEFFELIITDKRLTMIDNGFVDLKINHSTKMIVDEDEDEDMLIENEEDIEDDSSEEDKIEHNKSKTAHNSEPDVIEQVKREHPSVFICNRLTFLIKTRYPIIWDTSSVAEPYEDCLFIALDKGKNPLINMNEAAKISLQINTDQVIQKEIVEFLDGFRWKGIICTPYRMAINGENRFGFMFTLINDWL